MRHKNIGRYLNRSSSHRKAMFYNLSKNLIEHETIITTLPKAKELRRYIEPLITISKNSSLINKRKIFRKVRDKKIINKLFLVLGKRYINRPGGYTKILRYKYRKGDGATLAIIKLVS